MEAITNCFYPNSKFKACFIDDRTGCCGSMAWQTLTITRLLLRLLLIGTRTF